ncbi:unnamed protein product [Trichogramma brassicae]|uniref:Uncharacterized protein n=1 Tax=Trichogramma brassicae TaxID=86971 RepID=A0A6H5HS16_9HYME|nr:unnamed protein product [Trichogramma brassicae]
MGVSNVLRGIKINRTRVKEEPSSVGRVAAVRAFQPSRAEQLVRARFNSIVETLHILTTE